MNTKRKIEQEKQRTEASDEAEFDEIVDICYIFQVELKTTTKITYPDAVVVFFFHYPYGLVRVRLRWPLCGSGHLVGGPAYCLNLSTTFYDFNKSSNRFE